MVGLDAGGAVLCLDEGRAREDEGGGRGMWFLGHFLLWEGARLRGAGALPSAKPSPLATKAKVAGVVGQDKRSEIVAFEFDNLLSPPGISRDLQSPWQVGGFRGSESSSCTARAGLVKRSTTEDGRKRLYGDSLGW